MSNTNTNFIVQSYPNYDAQRYGSPWVGLVYPDDCKCHFTPAVGRFTGDYKTGKGGDLILYKPVTGAVYAYGQKDKSTNKGSTTYIYFDGSQFLVIPSDSVQAFLAEYHTNFVLRSNANIWADFDFSSSEVVTL